MKNLKSILLIISSALFLAFQSVPVFAVGAFFTAKSGGQEVYLPGARAFVSRNGIKEDLILQVGFAGNAADFCWVVPVPSRPTVKVTDPQVFDELAMIVNPRIIPPPNAPQSTDSKGQLPFVKVHDIRVFSPSEQQGVARWLVDNGYTVPPSAYPKIQDYVKRGWYFVVSKVHVTPDGTARWMQPLWITCDVPRATLPSKLTSLNPKPIIVQLFVATDVVVTAPGFTEAFTNGSPARTSFKLNTFPRFFQITVKDCKLTELRATLYPQQIIEDTVITPKPVTLTGE